MTTALGTRAPTTATRHGREPQQVADAFVIFGITGDLAKVMTFHSLYRLEQRGLLDCPIVGVAVSDWSEDDLREPRPRRRSRRCGEQIDDEVFDRLAARMSYVSGDFGDRGDLRAGRARDRRGASARCSIWRSRRSCSGE